MSRAGRIEFEGAHYHVMARGVEQTAVFPDDEDRRDFRAIVGELVKGGAFDVHAFRLMPNHCHLLITTARPSP